jgi:hypothetical protein
VAVTISLYNNTAKRFAEGSNISSDVYKLMLCTAATFSASNTTLASVTKTEVANANGYATGGATLSNVSFTTVGTNGAKLDADDVYWSATGGAITASYAILYNSSDADSPPVAFIDFGASETAGAGTDFLVVWNSNGIISWTVS